MMVIVGFYSTTSDIFVDYYADQKREDIGHSNATNKRNECTHTQTHLAEKNEKRENKMIKIQANFSSFNWKKKNEKKNLLLIE